MRRAGGALARRWCSTAPAPDAGGGAGVPLTAQTGSNDPAPVAAAPEGDAIMDAAKAREVYLREKWKSDPWPYPGLVAANDIPEGHVQRTFGIFDTYQTVDTDRTAKMPNSWIKERKPEWMRAQLMAPRRDDAMYTRTETPNALLDDDEAPMSWIIKRMVDQNSFEDALGEQLFRTQDLDRLSTELYPVGYGLAPNTCALIMEDEDVATRFYHICGGRSDHKCWVQGRCLTMRADIELMQHLLHYYGEFYGLARLHEKYHHKYRGMCVWGQGYDDEDEEFMNGFFDATGMAMRVDPERMDEACEGYCPVVFHHEGKVPYGDPHWTSTSTGVFIWQNYMQSMLSREKRDNAARHVKMWWRDPYLLRPYNQTINHRAFNGAAMPNGDPEFDRKWGGDGHRGNRLKQRAEQRSELRNTDPLTATNIQNHLKRGGREITDWYNHGFAHPMFTTKTTDEI